MKRPLQAGGSTYFLLITYPEIFGVPRPTIGEFRLRLAALPRLPLVKVCSVLNAVLENAVLKIKAEPSLPFNFQAHKELVAAYFPPAIARQILQLEHRNPPGVVFHRQQLLFVMKEALQYASDEVTGEMSNEALGELFLIANDHMHFERGIDSADILDKFAFIASTFLQLREGVAKTRDIKFCGRSKW